ncbi:MAG: porphobilinogen synthase [Planctomycetes bacterium]|nr:porphobilinogen synthase [Planctomycetota bacterium]
MPDSPDYRPYLRPRRLRRGKALRDLVADVKLTPDDLCMPLFVRNGQNINKPVLSMPGVSQFSPDRAAEEIEEQAGAGLKSFILFGVTDPDHKDALGSAALDASNPVCTTLRHVRETGLDVTLIADLCFCEYTDHGHCGPLHADPDITVDNDAALPLLGKQALVLAESGADIVAPSGMMDGQVGAIRQALDAAGRTDTAILSYSVKFASSLYGPFREAGEGSPQFGDRRGYQMDYRRSREWRTELELDIAEGADMVMVKPAATYLDILRQVRDATDLPVAAYHVSGEYSMIHAAAANGWLDLQHTAVEVTTAMKRAGADLILTYFAPKLLKWI